MQIDLTTLLTGINTLILVGGCLFYFKKNYVIMDVETYNQIAEALDEVAAQQEASQELAGGEGVQVGFGADYLEDDEEDE